MVYKISDVFEDLVSVYRNFLGQRSGSVSNFPSFLIPLSLVRISLFPLLYRG